MEPATTHKEALASLTSMSEFEATEFLIKALMIGCNGGITLARAEVYGNNELIHRFFGCQNDEKCDLDESTEAMAWETNILFDIDVICQEAPFESVKNMFSWMRLANIVAQHEELIRKRWLKKTQAQRKEILLEAMPSMPPSHRPDIEDILHTCCPYNRNGGIANHAMPYINLEDLTKPKSLLIMLNARGRHLPHTFAQSDWELAPLAQIRPMLLEDTHITMSFKGTYGGLVDCHTHVEAMASVHRGASMHPVHGYLVLSIHGCLLRFLTVCCEKILHEMSLTPIMSTSPNPFPPETPLLSDNSDLYSSLDVAVREASYQIPARLDLGRLEGLVSGCRNSAEDHIWALREDPSYFVEVVQEYREHRQELLKGRDGKSAHTATKERTLMNKVLRTVITDAYVELYIWDEIRHRILRLHQMSLDYADQIQDSTADLPQSFFDALVDTWFFLEATMLDIIHQIHRGWCASPAIRQCWTQDTSNTCSHRITAECVGYDSKDKDMATVFRLINCLTHAPYRNTLGIHAVVDAIERALQVNPRVKALTSPWIASYLSQLSVASECFHQLQLYQPWATKIKHCVEERKVTLFIAYVESYSKWHKVLLTKFQGVDLFEKGKPGGKFYYPVDKRRTRVHVESMRAAEAALDAFWEAADNRFREEAGRTPHDIVSKIIDERLLQRTAPWDELEDSKSKSNAKPVLNYVYIPISNASHDPSTQITGAFDRLGLKDSNKAKTHGLPSRATTEPMARPATPHGDDQVVFHVDKRAHKVFRTLFHSPMSRDQPGEIPWTDFLHAMVHTGFSAQKLQGSAWQFTPRDLNAQQPIQFHEPHPMSKLPFTWARRFGRRLTRTYGWKGDMFHLA